jgi:integrase
MEKAIFSIVYNRKNKLLTNGTALIQVRAYLNGICKYFTTNIYATPDQWDKKHNRVKNHQNAISINRQLYEFVAKMEKTELDRRNANKPFTLEILQECINGKEIDSFTQFMRNEIATDRNNTTSTKVQHTITLNMLCEYRKNILFDEIGFELMTEIEKHLLNKGLKVNTVNKYFRHIRKFINLAIDKDLFDLNRYPFRKFKMKLEETNREYLTPDEVQEIEKLTFTKENDYLQKVKDIFLFSCYCGLRFSDISALRSDQIQTINDKIWIVLESTIKTGAPLRIPLYLLFDGKPIEILKTYTKPDRKYIFDEHSNQYVNRCLKEIATLAGITKRLTFHTARHTQATYLLYKGVNITTVQKLLGHKKLATTQIYAKVMDMTMINELKAVTFTNKLKKRTRKINTTKMKVFLKAVRILKNVTLG